MAFDYEKAFTVPIGYRVKRKVRKKYDETFLDWHGLWALFCEDAQDCDDFVEQHEVVYMQHEISDREDLTSEKELSKTPMKFKDFVVLHNIEDQTVEYIGRVIQCGQIDSVMGYNYRCVIEWSQVEPYDPPYQFSNTTENPVLINNWNIRSHYYYFIQSNVFLNF